MCLADQLTLAAQTDDVNHMKSVVNDFFTPTGLIKLSLFDRNSRATKEFEVPCAAVPRFAALQNSSGVSAASLSPSFVREYFLTTPDPATKKPVHIGYVLDADATWTSRFDNGSRVDLRGFLRAHCVVTESRGLKIESIEFQSKHWDEVFVREMMAFEKVERMLAENAGGGGGGGDDDNNNNGGGRPPLKRKRSATTDQVDFEQRTNGLLPASIDKLVLPPPKVGSFGITEMGMRCLEVSLTFCSTKRATAQLTRVCGIQIAESVANLQDLIKYSLDTGAGPVESLARFAEVARQRSHQQQQHMGPSPSPSQYPNPNNQQPGPEGYPVKTNGHGPSPYAMHDQMHSPMPSASSAGQQQQHPQQQQHMASSPLNGDTNWTHADEQKASGRAAAAASAAAAAAAAASGQASRGRGGARGRPRGRRGS